jgi:hypothetical protein
MSPNSPRSTSLSEIGVKKTLHGPLAIYPGQFFLESWDMTWIKLLNIEPELLKKEKREILEKSPLVYLNPSEKQVLMLFNLHDLLTHLFHYRKNRDGLTSAQEENHHLLKSLKKKKKVCWDLFEQIEKNTPEFKKDDYTFFNELITSFLHFSGALIEDGEEGKRRSRKLMAMAHFHYREAKINLIKETLNLRENDHPYLDYYEALLLIGRGRWDEATALLHATLKRHHENTRLARLLCQLYLHAGLPHIAQFIRGKYLRLSLSNATKNATLLRPKVA